jgi:N-acetylgalactosamine kinase
VRVHAGHPGRARRVRVARGAFSIFHFFSSFFVFHLPLKKTQGSGLSSSSAFVCAAALAVCAAHGLDPPQAVKKSREMGMKGLFRGVEKKVPHSHPRPPTPLQNFPNQQDVATFAASCEKYVGTESGGMDQAISIMGQAGTAKLVSFQPTVSAADVALPPDAVFVVANSLAVSKKAETADVHYNLRVVECRLAAASLGRVLLGGEAADPGMVKGLTTLRAVEPLIENSPQFGPGVAGKLAAVSALLAEGAYDRETVEAAIGMPLADLLAGAPAQLRAAEGALAAGGPGLHLRSRAAHVYAEADRVHAFRAVAAGEGGGDALAGLGRLMDESQASCRCGRIGWMGCAFYLSSALNSYTLSPSLPSLPSSHDQ